jgi:hypothetical protein
MSRLETGILHRGVVLPGTGWILRDPLAWFDPDNADAPKRPGHLITQATFHWTAGRAHEGVDAARRVVRAMKARERPDGTLMSVSVHFVVTWDGRVFQVCDTGRMAIHAGRVINRASIGTELCWPGTESQMARLGLSGAVQRRQVGGRSLSTMRPSEELLGAAVRLAETLAGLPESTGIVIPRIVPAGTERMSPREARLYRGALEHCHSPGSEKVDCAGYVMDALATAGWSRR